MSYFRVREEKWKKFLFINIITLLCNKYSENKIFDPENDYPDLTEL